MKAIRYALEYAAVRVVAAVLQALPYRLALCAGWALAWLGFYGFRFRRRAAEARLLEIFGDRYTPRERRRIAWRSWRNFVFSGIELIRVPVSTPEWVRSIVDDGGTMIKLQQHLAGGQGAIVALLHMGSWELAALSCHAYGIPLFSLAAAQKNARVDAYLNRLRAQTGFETVLRDASALKQLLRRIRAGKVLAILPDVRAKTEALTVRFLGRPANVAGGLGFIAKQTGVPVFPCVITRVGWTRHRYRIGDPIRPDPALDKQADGRRITQQVFDVFDPCVRAEPEQWFWFNKRWLFDPLSA